MTRAPIFLLTLAALAGCKAAPDGNASNAAAQAAPATQTIPLVIQSAAKPHSFTVELALTPAQQEQGLMFRKELAPDRGMLFPFMPAKAPSFWMKNTVIPLDMIMVGADGKIDAIFADREPYSLEPASTGEPAVAVLEIPGGRAAALGIKVGDIVKWGQCPGTGNRPGESWDRLSFCP